MNNESDACPPSAHLFGVTIEPVGQDKEGGRPQPDEDAEPFCMSLGIGIRPTHHEPNGDRANDGSEGEKEAEIAELFELGGLHAN